MSNLSNFVKALEVKFPSKKSDTLGETIQKILSPRLGEVLWSSNFVKDLEEEFPSKKSDTFSETIQINSKSQPWDKGVIIFLKFFEQ